MWWSLRLRPLVFSQCNSVFSSSEVVDGYFSLPEGPGWGVDLNEDFIKDNPPEK